jgi:hypothetical protein
MLRMIISISVSSISTTSVLFQRRLMFCEFDEQGRLCRLQSLCSQAFCQAPVCSGSILGPCASLCNISNRLAFVDAFPEAAVGRPCAQEFTLEAACLALTLVPGACSELQV